jgi:hypothetical protein
MSANKCPSFLNNCFKYCFSHRFSQLSYHSRVYYVVEVEMKMKIKLLVALVIVGVLAVSLVGLVAAQIASPSPSGTGASANNSPINNFFGWVGNCFRFRGTPNYGVQTPGYLNAPANTATNPYTNTTSTYQGYFGPCMGRYIP